MLIKFLFTLFFTLQSIVSVYSAVSMDAVPVTITDSFLIHDLHRVFDLTTGSTTKVETEFSIRGSKSPSDKFILAIPATEADVHLAYLSATGAVSEKAKPSTLKVDKADFDAKRQVQYYQVSLPKKLEQDEDYFLVVKETYISLLKPFPKQVGQLEPQKLLYDGPLYFTSPYSSASQRISFTLETSSLISYTDVDPVKKKGRSALVYGPFNNVAAFASEKVKIHFQLSAAILISKTRHAVYEFSHWGNNLAVEEKYELHHKGALLKGQFGRIEHIFRQHEQSKTATVGRLIFEIPKNSKHIYFRDYVGNVSTSELENKGKRKFLTLRPRFPLFGGWKYSWWHGYSVPLSEYVNLDTKTGSYVAKIPFMEKVNTDLAIQKSYLQIILPEAATNVRAQLPFGVDKEDRSFHYTYLDTVGRHVLLFEKHNVVDDHCQDIVITYDLSTITLLYKPFACAVAFFLIFLSNIIYNRSDFSIRKDPKADAQLKALLFKISVQSSVKEVQGALSSLEKSFVSYKSEKDAEKFKEERSKIEATFESALKKVEVTKTQASGLIQDAPTILTLINGTTALVSHLKDILANEKKKHGDMINLFKDLSSGNVDDAKKKSTMERIERVDQENADLHAQVNKVLKSFK